MNDLLISKYSGEIKRIARKYGAVRIRLFGSRATGEATESSDIDILADFEPGRDLWDLVGLKQDLEELLGRKVDVLEEEGLSPYLREQILQGAQIL